MENANKFANISAKIAADMVSPSKVKNFTESANLLGIGKYKAGTLEDFVLQIKSNELGIATWQQCEFVTKLDAEGKLTLGASFMSDALRYNFSLYLKDVQLTFAANYRLAYSSAGGSWEGVKTIINVGSEYAGKTISIAGKSMVQVAPENKSAFFANNTVDIGLISYNPTNPDIYNVKPSAYANNAQLEMKFNIPVDANGNITIASKWWSQAGNTSYTLYIAFTIAAQI